MFKIHLNTSGATSVPTSLIDPDVFAERWAKEVADSLNAAKKLKDPFTYKIKGKGEAVISSKSPGLPFLLTGTKPHKITGNPLLHFLVQGQDVFARSVMHPGTKADQKLVDAVDDIYEVGQRLLDKLIIGAP